MPRAQFVEYDVASPAPRNACTKNTRKALLDKLQVWANDETTTKLYWLNGMAGTGKTTIAYSFSEILHENGSLGGNFFCSHLWVDTSDVHCIIPTISLQSAHYLPSLSQKKVWFGPVAVHSCLFLEAKTGPDRTLKH